MTKDELEAIRQRVEAALEYEPSEWDEEQGCYVSDCTGKDDHDWFHCPLCDGDGSIEGQRYDAKGTIAATVVAFGIGEGLRRAEEWVENAPADMRALLAEVERLTAERDAAFRRGVAAMREAAAQRVASYRIKVMDPFGNLATVTGDPMPIVVAEIRALPDPEDKP